MPGRNGDIVRKNGKPTIGRKKLAKFYFSSCFDIFGGATMY